MENLSHSPAGECEKMAVSNPAYYVILWCIEPRICRCYINRQYFRSLGSCVWLLGATLLRLPVSATHSIVGATVGFAFAVNGMKGINVGKLGLISTYRRLTFAAYLKR